MRGQTFIVAVPAKIVHTVTASLIVGVIVATAILTRPASVPSTPPLETTVSVAPGCQSIGLIPSPCIWHLHNVSFIVQSAYAYEIGLTQNVTPVADDDYGTSNQQERVYLPGGRWNLYRFVGSVFVAGSGTVLLMSTPGGFPFALVHMDGSSVPPGLPPPVTAQAPVPPNNGRLSDGELTALAVQQAMSGEPRLTPGQTYRGGTYVGLSRWPDSPIYGNGTSGPADAHLCLVLTQGSRDFFLRIAAGIDPAPKPKKKPWPKAWGKRPHKDRHGKLLFQARQWLKHQRLGAYTGHDHWTKKTKTMRYGFIHGSLLCSFKTGKCKVTR